MASSQLILFSTFGVGLRQPFLLSCKTKTNRQPFEAARKARARRSTFPPRAF